MTDVRLAFRRLAAAPGFLTAAVLTLALGMGANALVFSAVNGLLLRPLPFSDAERIVWVLARTPQSAGEHETVSHDEGELLARGASPFRATAVIGDAGLVRELERRHDRWLGIWATPSLFDVLQIRPVAGSVPSVLPPNDAPRAILISHERWIRDFGGDAAIIGRPLEFSDGKRFVLAGVLPPGLEFPFGRSPHKGHGAGFHPGVQDFWILAPDRPGEHPGGLMIARLADNRTAQAAAAEVTAISTSLPNRNEGRTLLVVPMREQVLGLLGRVLPLLQLFSILVLLIACGNLANLMLARAAAQHGDDAIRIALGARRVDLVRLHAMEVLIIAGTGALLALALAAGGRQMLAAMAPGPAALFSRIAIDGAVFAFLGATAIVITAIFGIVPALRRGDAVLPGGSAGSRHTASGWRRTAGWLAVSQIALSLTLLGGAAALRTSLDRLLGVDAGYDTSQVVAAETLLFIPPREATPMLDELLTRLQALPFVEAASFVHSTPLTGKWTVRDTFEVQDGPAAGLTPEMPGSFVSHGFFATLGIPILAGRNFDAADMGRRDFPIIINDVAARRFFPHRNPVGAWVTMTGRLREIVGVVKATRDLRLDTPAEPQWYQPGMSGSSELLVRVTGRPGDRVGEIRAQLTATDPRTIVQRVIPLDDIVADSVLERRLASRIVSVFAGVALALAAVGLFGVMHVGVTRRGREFAIRSALGATRGAIVRNVLAQGLLIAGAGVAAGTAASFLVAGWLQRVLFETPAISGATLGATALVLVAVALVATLPPAWRAASSDPRALLQPE